MKRTVMDESESNNWSGNNVFAHLNDFEPSEAESILDQHRHQQSIIPSCPAESECNETITPDSPETNNNNQAKPSKESGNAKIGIKLPKLEGTNKNYVLQYHEEMTQDFMDYLKELHASHHSADHETGKKYLMILPAGCSSIHKPLCLCVEKSMGSFHIKCEYCKEQFSTDDFEFHQCDLFEDNAFDDRNVLKQIRENNALIATLLKNNAMAEAEGSSIGTSQPKAKDTTKNKKKNGPFECTLCDRKFIYESGLTSHMAKHALECPLEPKQLLKHVVKCLMCSQVLNGDNVPMAIEHFVKNHGYSVECGEVVAADVSSSSTCWKDDKIPIQFCVFSDGSRHHIQMRDN